MIQMLEYITQNYTFLLGVLVLILLAIIGYYADKTNFGQGKNKESEVENQSKQHEEIGNSDQKIMELIEKKEPEIYQQGIQEEKRQEENYEPQQLKEIVDVQTKKTEIIEEQIKNKELEEIDMLLPKKELINSDLLNEIDGMELNSLKKKATIDVPNLDDISLPKIKNLVESEQDIWKF